ncbi:MAG: hypothetical protein A2283_22785 [Lentisphaerae bacterium RIFOXYA12_FULL_48_11]|nr:MAG: hypothetical protein A2283_22785 [Lentisphaerae bacterium RIFOXYA12_FULL_48_11]
MIREQSQGNCEHCGKTFPYHLIHSGFNDSTYAYCDTCGMTAILNGWSAPKGRHVALRKVNTVIVPEDESLLSQCQCGGQFKSGAAPRCPHCHATLSAISAKQWIEANAPGTAKGWDWQCSWTGTYAIVIDDRVIEDNGK